MGSRFDDELWELIPEEDRAQPRSAVAFVRSLGHAGAALDLGCGDGTLATEIDSAELTLADVSAIALARARGRHPGAAAAELEPDAPLPFADNRFDLVLCAETLEHVRDLQMLLSEARRVLRPGGRIAVTTPAHSRLTAVAILAHGFERVFPPLSPHLRFLTKRSLRGLLGELGFDVIELRSAGGTLFAVGRR